MSRLAAMHDLLLNSSGVTDLVGTRFYPNYPPQKSTFPLLVFSLGNNSPTDSKDGVSILDEESLQVDVYAATAKSAELIDEAVRSAIDNYSGTRLSVIFRKIWYTGNTPPTYDSDLKIHWRSSDYRIKIER